MKKLFKIFSILFIGLSISVSAYATNISNADIDDEDFSDISDWTDQDAGTGTSYVDGTTTLKQDTGGTAGAGNYAQITQDIGTYGTRTVFSFKTYFYTIGTFANTDYFRFLTYDGTYALTASFCSDGLYVRNGVGTQVQIDSDIVVQDTWQEWTFDVDWANGNTDIYLDKVLQYSDVAIRLVVGSEGVVIISQYGTTTINQITYVDWFKAGSDFAPTLYKGQAIVITQ